ncbi:hypothetical protein ACFLXU_02785 [Chloroflexota bacterium]
MKNRFHIIIALILALIISGGVYAYTYSTASGTMYIAEPTGDIATSNTTETQPDWESVLVPVNDAVFLRPYAAGDETQISDQYPVAGEHWDKVDEESSDGDDTYIVSGNTTWEEDLYNITDHSTQTAGGTINYVTVYMVCSSTANATQSNAYIHIKTNGVEYNGTTDNTTIDYTTYWHQWDNNPQTDNPWTWDEIDALQIGVGLTRAGVSEFTRCTQVYAEVDFDAPPLTGSISTGDLFMVYPHTDYPGDMAVKVYIINTGDLTNAYKYLNMEIYLEGSVEAGETPNYRLLTLQNGMAAFTLIDGGSDNHTLSVTGGDYTLTSREPQEWEEGWTVTPEFYCEITQR